MQQHGITQFLDVGCGRPAAGATHQVARQLVPGCTVTYGDSEPMVLVHARALLTPEPGRGACHYPHADVRDPCRAASRSGRGAGHGSARGPFLLLAAPAYPGAIWAIGISGSYGTGTSGFPSLVFLPATLFAGLAAAALWQWWLGGAASDGGGGRGATSGA